MDVSTCCNATFPILMDLSHLDIITNIKLASIMPVQELERMLLRDPRVMNIIFPQMYSVVSKSL